MTETGSLPEQAQQSVLDVGEVVDAADQFGVLSTATSGSRSCPATT
jgi:hypothetical protein